MKAYTDDDAKAVTSVKAADNDTSNTVFAAGASLEANLYHEIEAEVVVYGSASNAGKTVTITFLTKATDDGIVGTWDTVKAEAAVAIADAAGTYVVRKKLSAREFGKKFANAKAVVALADPGTDVIVSSLVLRGIAKHRT